jgi:hypothetical protein
MAEGISYLSRVNLGGVKGNGGGRTGGRDDSFALRLSLRVMNGKLLRANL